MLKRIKEYIKYRKNKKIAKREIAAIAATALPLVRNISDTGKNITDFIMKLSKETKNVEGEELIQIVLDEVADVLNSDSNRIVEIFTYIANLSPQDIQKIIVHSVTETIRK